MYNDPVTNNNNNNDDDDDDDDNNNNNNNYLTAVFDVYIFKLRTYLKVHLNLLSI